jgi:hypothetical protein
MKRLREEFKFILSLVTSYPSRIIRETIEIEKHPCIFLS